MTARAGRAGRREGRPGASRFAAASLAAFAAVLISTAARAEVGAVASIYSDDRFRGVSVSDGRPVGILDLSYDAANGLYAAASGSVVATRGDGLKPLGLVLNGGYAERFRSGLNADVGVVYSHYSHYSGVSSGRDYTEVYAGLIGKILGARLSVSPNYLGFARWTVRAEVSGHVDLARTLYVDGELGALTALGHSASQGKYKTIVDARIGVARSTGPVTLHAAATVRSGSAAIYGLRERRHAGLIIGISSAF